VVIWGIENLKRAAYNPKNTLEKKLPMSCTFWWIFAASFLSQMRGGHGRKLTNVSEDGFIKDFRIS
jgi:hypothetical protein